MPRITYVQLRGLTGLRWAGIWLMGTCVAWKTQGMLAHVLVLLTPDIMLVICLVTHWETGIWVVTQRNPSALRYLWYTQLLCHLASKAVHVVTVSSNDDWCVTALLIPYKFGHLSRECILICQAVHTSHAQYYPISRNNIALWHHHGRLMQEHDWILTANGDLNAVVLIMLYLWKLSYDLI